MTLKLSFSETLRAVLQYATLGDITSASLLHMSYFLMDEGWARNGHLNPRLSGFDGWLEYIDISLSIVPVPSKGLDSHNDESAEDLNRDSGPYSLPVLLFSLSYL